jgi:hypothetical protein
VEEGAGTSVDVHRYNQVKLLFQSAMDIEPARRAEYIARKTAGDASLRREVEALLECHTFASGFMEQRAPVEGADRPPAVQRVESPVRQP